MEIKKHFYSNGADAKTKFLVYIIFNKRENFIQIIRTRIKNILVIKEKKFISIIFSSKQC